jgi:hypothetical protein
MARSQSIVGAENFVHLMRLTIFNSGGYGVWSGGTLRGMPEV